MKEASVFKVRDERPGKRGGKWARRWREYSAVGTANVLPAFACRLYLGKLGRLLPGRGSYVSFRLPASKSHVLLRLGSSDSMVYREVFIDGEYDAILQPALGPIRTVVDLGSNVGLSLRFWREKFPGVRMIGVEPDEGNLQACRRNCSLAGLPEPILVRAFVGGSRRHATLEKSGREWGYRMSGQTGVPGQESIDVLTMPDLLDRAGFDGEIDLVKCDIEGAEEELFADCRHWIGRVRNLFVEVHGAYSRERLESDLKRNGYKCVLHPVKLLKNVQVFLVRRTA